MLKFVFRKMLNKKWMILSLLIGNVFFISIAMSGPMYIDAVTQNLMTRTLADSYRETGEYPALFTLEANVSKGSRDSVSYQEYLAAGEDMANLPSQLLAPALYETKFSRMESVSAKTLMDRADAPSSINLAVASMTGLEDHITLLEGALYSAEPDESGVYNALISRSAYVRKNLILGEELHYRYITAPNGDPLTLRVAGVFDSTDDPWWTQDESCYTSEIFIPEALFNQLFMGGEQQEYSVATLWTTHIDYEAMRADNAAAMLSAIDTLNAKYNLVYTKPFQASCEEMLRNYRTQANQASATLRVLQVPIFALMIAFIFMVSRQILEIEQSEISVLKSRGASGRQVRNVYLVQGFLLALVSFAISIPMSAFLCRAIGSASAFLQFDNPVTLRIGYDMECMLYALAAALLSVLTMVGPAISYSRLTIVDSKRTQHALGGKPWWQKFCLDFVVLAVSLYGLYSFISQKYMLAERVAGGGALDPLLYIASSLFVVGAALVAVRFIPIIASGVFKLFKKHWNPAMYASFLQILRSRNSQTFMMTFLILTIAIGMLGADTASTVNTSQEEQLRHDLGADVVLQEAWTRVNGEYLEPDTARYEQIPGVESISKVFRDDAGSATVGAKTLQHVQLMGIDTRTFGLTAHMKDGLLPEHFYTYLNSMSQTLNGCLLSSNFRDVLGCEIGDKIDVRASTQSAVTLTITGFVDYFPAYNVTELETLDDGAVRVAASRYLVVTNFGYLKTSWGVQPFELWIKSPGNADAVSDFASASGTRYWKYSDIYSRIDAMKNSPSIQGTNGILTLSFIIGLTLCAAGFLIFWILSIKSRSLQFGIYRAMGMSVRELIAMLINEHIWQSVTSVLAGIGIGYLVSRLYIPLIQIAYSSADASLPLQVTRDLIDHIRLITIIAAVLVVCVCVLIAIIRRLRMAQAIKLGED